MWGSRPGRRDGVDFYQHPGHVFGLGASVVNFQRYPMLVAAVHRSLIGVATAHYVDDFILPDVEGAATTAGDTLRRLIRAYGRGNETQAARARRTRRQFEHPRLDPDKDKPAALENVGLGVIVDTAKFRESGYVEFRPKPERVELILQQWEQGFRTKRMTSVERYSLAGRRNFVLDTAIGRLGRASSQPLYDTHHRAERDDTFTRAMEEAYAFDKAVLGGRPPRLPPLIMHVHEDTTPPILVYTDAAFKWRRKRQLECAEGHWREAYLPREHPLPQPWNFQGTLGYVMYDPTDGALETGQGVPDEQTVRYLLGFQRRTYIAYLEALAAITPYNMYAERMAGRRVMHFIDNTVALSALVHGYVAKEDLARLVNAFHAMSAGMTARTYMDYVPSKANIADLPSRSEYTLLHRLGARRRAMEVPTHAQIVGPYAEWLERARAAASESPRSGTWAT
jgi:hypothetical protein